MCAESARLSSCILCYLHMCWKVWDDSVWFILSLLWKAWWLWCNYIWWTLNQKSFNLTCTYEEAAKKQYFGLKSSDMIFQGNPAKNVKKLLMQRKAECILIIFKRDKSNINELKSSSESFHPIVHFTIERALLMEGKYCPLLILVLWMSVWIMMWELLLQYWHKFQRMMMMNI